MPAYTAQLDGEVAGTKIGLPREYFEGLSSESGDRIHQRRRAAEELGCEVRDISLPATKYAVPCYYIICDRRGQLQPGAL